MERAFSLCSGNYIVARPVGRKGISTWHTGYVQISIASFRWGRSCSFPRWDIPIRVKHLTCPKKDVASLRPLRFQAVNPRATTSAGPGIILDDGRLVRELSLREAIQD